MPLTGLAELQFTGAVYSDYITVHGFINRIADADKSPEVGDIYRIIVDMLRQAGIPLANHLSLAGRSSCYGVWHLFDGTDLDQSVSFLKTNYPKFTTFTDIIANENCKDFLINLAPYEVGAGLALKTDGFDDYVDLSVAGYVPSESGNYSLEMWVNAYDADTVRTLFSLGHSSGVYNKAYLGKDKRLIWEIASGGIKNTVYGPYITFNGLMWHLPRATIDIPYTSMAKNQEASMACSPEPPILLSR